MDFKKFKDKYQKIRPIEYPSKVPDAPTLSVVLITYQHANYIHQCIKNILAQETTFQFEILIGEDQSSDDTRNICIEYAEKYPEKIRLFFHHRENQIKVLDGPTGNFNAFYNFFSARGKYIAFCEGDDFWADPLKLQKEVDFLESNSEFVLTYHKYTVTDANNGSQNSETEILQPKFDILANDLKQVKHHPLLLCSCFKNILVEIPEEILKVINVDTFLFSLLGNYGHAKFLEEIQPSQYRKHDGGIWSKKQKQKKFLSKILTYEKLTEFYFRKGDMELKIFFESRRLNVLKMLALNQIKSGDILPGFQTLAKIFAK